MQARPIKDLPAQQPQVVTQHLDLSQPMAAVDLVIGIKQPQAELAEVAVAQGAVMLMAVVSVVQADWV
jgi:hypothetical protein